SERFERLLRQAFAPLGAATLTWARGKPLEACRVSLRGHGKFEFALNPRERLTPQAANQLFQRLRDESLARPLVTQLVIAPTISPRIAEIAARYGSSWLDYAGNFRILNPHVSLYLAQSGQKLARDKAQKSLGATDIFSPRSSRIVRALLENPGRGWQVAELARAPEIDVSLGLASRIKQALVEQNYATVKQRLLYLTQPDELLAAWARNYRGPVEERLYYLRGDVTDVEQNVARWCERQGLTYALARYSAAARLAPGLRYSLASLYVGSEFFDSSHQRAFHDELAAQRVDSGATLAVLTPYDSSVFVGRQLLSEQVTSPLQTWLDLQ
ncbi:MAG: type IV toxin-antitoxin system AbiEi family antitoxin, partial [Planctomycetota bacterium]